MERLVTINSHDVLIKEYNGQRVVTFKDIDNVHERPDGTARRNFNANKKHLVEDEDYFVRNSYEALQEYGITAPNGLTLLTESGYLMLVKSFTDDLAWDVQRKLVKTYFGVKDAFDNMSTELRAVIVVDQRVTKIEKRVDQLENDVPLYGSEADELSRIVKKRGTQVLGGKNSAAYNDAKIRSEVYVDIYNQIKREYGLYDHNGKPTTYKALKRRYFEGAKEMALNYTAPTYLQEKINDCNSQITLDVKRPA